MDTFSTPQQRGPTQEIPSQQTPIQPAVTITSGPAQQPSQKSHLRKLLNTSSWVILFALLPLTVLIFLSQDSIPGDLFYPVKRSLENVVLAAASVSPATRAAFRTDLTTRRFDEAEKLLLASSSNNGLYEFVTEIQAAQNEVSAISDPVKKQELQQKIQTSVTEYEKRLNVVKVKLVEQEEVSQLALAPTNTPVPFPTSTPKTPIRSKSPTATSTITPIISTDASTTAEIQAPTLTPIPSFTPTLTPTPPQSKEGEAIGTVDRVQDFLRCLKNTPPPHRECAPPEIKSERRREEKETRSEGNEDERKDKHEKEKKDSSDRENRMLKEDQK